MESIYDDVLINIFKFIDFENYKNVRSTCKRWCVIGESNWRRLVQEKILKTPILFPSDRYNKISINYQLNIL